MHQPRSRRLLAAALAASALLHAGAVWLADLFLPREAVRVVFLPVSLPPLPARALPAPAGAARLRPAAEPAAPRGLRGAAAAVDGLAEAGARADGAAAPAPFAADGMAPGVLGARAPYEARPDCLEVPAYRGEHVTERPVAPSAVDLDAERRARTVVVVDPDDPRNLRVWMRLPAHPNMGRRAAVMAQYWRRGFLLGSDDAVDLELELDVLAAHHRLKLGDLRRYALVWTDLLREQPPVEDLAGYLEEGGFLLTGSFDAVEAQLRRRRPAAVERVYLTREHPLFHAFFDVDYQFLRNLPAPRNPCKYNVMPVDALQLDGRVVALATWQTFDPGFVVYGWRQIYYNEYAACLSNKFAVNVFLYGLIQPGGFAGRYRARTPVVSQAPPRTRR